MRYLKIGPEGSSPAPRLGSSSVLPSWLLQMFSVGSEHCHRGSLAPLSAEVTFTQCVALFEVLSSKLEFCEV